MADSKKKDMEDGAERIIEEFYREKGMVGSKQAKDVEEWIARLLNEGVPY